MAQKRGVLRADSHMVNIDSGVARLCPDLRCRKARIQAFSSRAGVQEGTRWQSTTPSNQNRILLQRRPHQNLIDNEIWTPWATFSTKSGVPIGLFLRFFCNFIPNQKHRFGSKKGDPPRRFQYGKHRFSRCPVLPGLARPCPALPGFEVQETRIQAFSSRAGVQEGTRWQSTTPSN